MRLWPPKAAAAAICLTACVEAQDWAALREAMVRNQIQRRGVRNESLLNILRDIPRHEFVPDALRRSAYEDRPLPIGHGQTISQPYIVASMTELLGPRRDDKVLEIGTGSGYQTAVLARLSARVYTIEIVEPLAREAATRLRNMGYTNIVPRAGDGYEGWPEEAPFDRIILTAAPPELPAALVKQLKPGGRLVAPIGREWQELVVVDKDRGGEVSQRSEYPVMFVPMVPKNK
ncbi:MAG: protein-L-isoaspartate(D-aspartate) O-methyltransferase [Acidobacteria bacterium]|nr:protein-L-isoaspartate(D-aspartate) O-methyltransferase [Acidobacteriota bacterium]